MRIANLTKNISFTVVKDFDLFRRLKNCIEEMKFQDIDELVSTICELLIAIQQETLDKVFIEWIVRLEAVVANGGEYINP